MPKGQMPKGQMTGTMTLDRHRSILIPEVDLGGDGRLVVSEVEGTFPARGQPSKDRLSLPAEFNVEVQSFRSYNPKPKKRQKVNEAGRFGEEVKRLSGTLKSQSSSASLQKKIRRLHGEEPPARAHSWQYDSTHPARYFSNTPDRGTWSSQGNNRRKVDKKHRLSADAALPGARRNSMNSKNGQKPLDVNALKDYKQKKKNSRPNSILEIYNSGMSPVLRQTSKGGLSKRLIEEELPSSIFLVTGIALLAAGITHALISPWHIFYCLIWTSALVIIMSLTGQFHKTDYLTKWLNGLYIGSGLLSSLAVMFTLVFILQVSLPMVIRLSDNMPPSEVIGQVSFTQSNLTIIQGLTSSQTVWATLALQVVAFVFCLIQFFGLTASMVATSNHWDAVYFATSECNHRGEPRYFNPFEQVSIAQASGLIGIFVFVMWPKSNLGPHHYYSTLWAPALVFLASMVGLFHGKREDFAKLGFASFLVQIFALCAIAASAILVLLGLVDNIDKLSNGVQNSVEKKELTTSSVCDGFYVGCVFVNVVFIVGFLIRSVRKLCALNCLSLNDSNSS